MKPVLFEDILNAARKLAGFDEVTNLYKTPGLALKIGTAFKDTIDVLYSQALTADLDQLKKECTELKELFRIRWSSEFSANAHRTSTERKKTL